MSRRAPAILLGIVAASAAVGAFAAVAVVEFAIQHRKPSQRKES